MKHAGRNKKGVLDMVTTAILLVTFILVIIFLTVSIAMVRIQGNSAGKILLKVSVGSAYDEQRNVLYLTDEYGNKVTDMIGQALLIPNAKIILPGNPGVTVAPEAIDNPMYQCSGKYAIGTFDNTYDRTIIPLNDYIHCYIIPKKLEKMYGKGGYCMHVIYDERPGGANTETLYGNATLGCASEKKVTADIAPPPGFNRPIYLRMIRT